MQVNVEDLNQLLAYHEVFGKLQTPNPVELGTAADQQNHNSAVTILHNSSAGMVVKSCDSLISNSNSGEVISADLTNLANSSTSSSPSIVPTGTHTCDICGKIFPFRYQMIVHRRYHAEKKPFTCQVIRELCNNNIIDLQKITIR